MFTRSDKLAMAAIAIWWLIGAAFSVGVIYMIAHFIIKYW